MATILLATAPDWLLGADPAKTAEDAPKPPEIITPTYEIPASDAAPVLDGVINPDEWRQAVSFESGGGIPRRCTFWVTWNRDSVYIAQRSPLREGERPIRRFRDPAKPASVLDDSCEFYFQTDQVGKFGRVNEFFQVITGPANNTVFYELNQYSIGQRLSNWRGGWETANRITPDKKFFESEIKVPVKGFFYQGELKDGTVWGIELCRNWKRPWQQAGRFVQVPITRPVFKTKAPAVRLSALASLSAGQCGLQLAIDPLGVKAKGTIAIDVQQDTDTVLQFSSPFELDGKTPVTVGPFPKAKFVKGKPGSLAVTVRREDGSVMFHSKDTFLEGDRLGLDFVPDADAFFTEILTNPLKEVTYMSYDFDELDEAKRAAVTDVKVRIEGASGRILEVDSPPPRDFRAELKVDWPKNLPFGKYEWVFALVDAAGKDVSTVRKPFEKLDIPKEFPWWGNSIGISRKVLDPWEPVTAGADWAEVWGRRIEFAPTGFIAQMTSQGVPLLAAPISLAGKLADGTPIDFVGKRVTLLDRAQDMSVHQA